MKQRIGWLKERFTAEQWNVLGYFAIFLLTAPIVDWNYHIGLLVNVGCCALLLAVIVYREKPLNWTKRAVYQGLLWGLMLVAVEVAILAISFGLSGHRDSYTNQNSLIIMWIVKHYSYYLIYVILIAPPLEEIVFRHSLFKIIQKWLLSYSVYIKPRWSWWFSTILVGVCFALMHSTTQVGVSYVLLSIALQAIYHRYHNLTVNTIAHVIFNLAAVGMLLG